MFNFLKSKPIENLETVNLKLSGLHCTSCAISIDLTLEDIPGVQNSSTNYAKSELTITFDPAKTNLKSIKKSIHNLGYIVS
ncbi:MAG TPA: heavy metal-associated domain-containing protein [Spirochaetia bacterium]|nr:heavy metal-associated domain-containing protein [Spirochaetia bacterium]